VNAGALTVSQAEPNVFGYLLHLLFVFLPGIGFAESLNLWRNEEGFMERVGLSLGLGLAVDTVVIMVRTSGFSVSRFVLRGLDTATVYSVILAGIALLLSSVAVRRRFTFLARPKSARFVPALGHPRHGLPGPPLLPEASNLYWSQRENYPYRRC